MRWAVGGLVGAVLLLVAGVWGALRVYEMPGPLAERRVVVVPRAGVDGIAELLGHEGVVRWPLVLEGAALATRGQGPLRSAELEFPAHASVAEVLQVLRSGKAVQHRLTVPEGLTATQVALLMDRSGVLEGPVAIPVEGEFLPETYAFERGTTREALLDRGRRAMDRALRQAWVARNGEVSVLGGPRDALILASIVERETGRADERPRIATVFLNRLRRGMKLQSDPTVVYGASGGIGVLDHGITRAELDRDDPYNTYRIAGLPPGPISMPSLAALRAVTQPVPGDELYFVADGQGGHLFARTEQDHLRNVAHWRELERQRVGLNKPVAN